MKQASDSEKLRGCDAYTAQQRNDKPEPSNSERNAGATNSLKTLAHKVLERNGQRNSRATGPENTRNYRTENRAPVAPQSQHGEMFPQDKGPAVVMYGRTFRRCSKCKRMGWYPQATAEICCGMAMERIDHPSMTIDEYRRFIHCSGCVEADILAMMAREGIKLLPSPEQLDSGDPVRHA